MFEIDLNNVDRVNYVQTCPRAIKNETAKNRIFEGSLGHMFLGSFLGIGKAKKENRNKLRSQLRECLQYKSQQEITGVIEGFDKKKLLDALIPKEKENSLFCEIARNGRGVAGPFLGALAEKLGKEELKKLLKKQIIITEKISSSPGTPPSKQTAFHYSSETENGVEFLHAVNAQFPNELKDFLKIRNEEYGLPNKTSVHCAAKYGNVEFVLALIGLIQDEELKELLNMITQKDGETVLHEIARTKSQNGGGFFNVVANSLQPENLKKLFETTNKNGETSFYVALKSGNGAAFFKAMAASLQPEEVKKILKMKNKNGETPLCEAVRNTNFRFNDDSPDGRRFNREAEKNIQNAVTFLGAVIDVFQDEKLYILETILRDCLSCKSGGKEPLIRFFKNYTKEEQNEMLNLLKEKNSPNYQTLEKIINTTITKSRSGIFRSENKSNSRPISHRK